jgi:site-specific DNA-cytosine methylase
MKKIYKAIDLFAGIGGIRLGFEQAFKDDIEFVYANEIDNFCCETYEANFRENPKEDIRKVNITEEIPEKPSDFDNRRPSFRGMITIRADF